MMYKILFQIFKTRFKFFYLLVAGIGLVIGCTLFLFSGYFYVQKILPTNNKESSGQYMVLTKDVSLANTLFFSSPQFSNVEIEALKKEKFVRDVGAFRANQFKVWLDARPTLPFATDAFVESVPDRFIDDMPDRFRWREGDDVVPLLIPPDFIYKLNVFLKTQGMPQIPQESVTILTFRLETSKGEKIREFKAKVVGFSDRITTILVPDTFVAAMNQELAGIDDLKTETGSVIIRTNDSYADQLEKYIDDHSLIVNKEKLNASKASGEAQWIIQILIVIGTVFLLFSFLVVVLNFSLILAEAQPDIILLSQLGYRNNTIIFFLIKILLVFVAIVSLLAIVINSIIVLYVDPIIYTSASSHVISTWSLYALILVGINGGLVLLTWSSISAKLKSTIL